MQYSRGLMPGVIPSNRRINDAVINKGDRERLKKSIMYSNPYNSFFLTLDCDHSAIKIDLLAVAPKVTFIPRPIPL